MSRHQSRTYCPAIHVLLPAIAILLWLLFVLSTPVDAAPEHQATEKAPPTSTTLLVGIVPGAPRNEVNALIAQAGLKQKRSWSTLNIIEVTLDQPRPISEQAAAATIAAQANLGRSPFVRYVTYDAPVELAALPTDPRAPEQWAFAATHAADGWNITRGDERVVVALLDTGYAMNHEDLPHDRLWINEAEANGQVGVDDDANGYIDDVNGWDWIDEDAVPDDQHGHGTHVSGVIAAGTNNGIGIAGHGQDLRIAPLRVLDSNGTGFISDLVAALDYAREQDFPIINLSLTVGQDSPALHDAIKAAHAGGSIVVAATGNKGSGVQWPALYDETIAVAATTSSNSRWAFSNFGPTVDMAAPGADVLSTYIQRPLCPTPCDVYALQTGTSMATPHVSALAGLIMSVRPDFTITDTVDLMKATAADLNVDTYPGTDIYLGAGAIDYRAALVTASAPLSLSYPVSLPVSVPTGAEVEIPQHVELVQAGKHWEIAGAVVSYTLTLTDGTPLTDPAAAVTDLDGMARVTVSTPITPGIYLLHSMAGQSTRTISLTVGSMPVTPTLTVEALTTTVGGPTVPFTVTIADPHAVISDTVLPLHLATSLGTFGGGESEKIVLLSGPVYVGTLEPGTVPGTAHLSATVAGISAAASVAVLPGEPANLGSPLDDEPPLIIASEETILSFEATDAYGNAVADQTTIVVTTSVGIVTPTETTTVNGLAATTLTIPPHAPGPVIVTATIPGTDLSYQLEIALIQDLYIPLIRSVPAPEE